MPTTRSSTSRALAAAATPATAGSSSKRRRRQPTGHDGGGFDLLGSLPPDMLVHILCLLPHVEDLGCIDCVCRLFSAPREDFGHSIVEATLRTRSLAQTGRPVPSQMLPFPEWWPWQTTKAKLFHDERCRRGVRLTPEIPRPKRNKPQVDHRTPIVYFRPPLKREGPPTDPGVILGRKTRAFNNGQGIEDPRVSRLHAELKLLVDDPLKANGLAQIKALGHNPSTITRAEPIRDPSEEGPAFKLRRGDVNVLFPGDRVHFVCEDVSRAHGRSIDYKNNPCTYIVDYVPPHLDLSPPLVVYGRTAGEAAPATPESQTQAGA
jgi:hypothetical protein